jgi:hypothetical protein
MVLGGADEPETASDECGCVVGRKSFGVDKQIGRRLLDVFVGVSKPT